ncbi:MAG: hypothetical protein WCJ53_15330, partial [Mycobacteriaceae bacterium]
MPESKSATHDRRLPKAAVRAIEYSRRVESVTAPRFAKYVGRVGALAVALGVGSGLAAMPLAFADTTGSAGSAGSGSSDSSASAPAGSSTKASAPARRSARGSASGSSSSGASSDSTVRGGGTPAPAAPNRHNSDNTSSLGNSGASRASIQTSQPADVAIEAATVARDDSAPAVSAVPAAASVAVSGSGSNLLSWLGSGDGDAPDAAPLMWTALATTRRDSGIAAKTAKPAAATITGEPADSLLGSAARGASPSASAVGAWQPGSILRIFFGNGTEDNVNGGIIVGNGYSWTASTCTSGTACNGGNGGIFGNGGNGYNGGNGGAAGW